MQTGKKTVSTSEAEIRALTEHWVEAVRKKDFDAIMSHYADNVAAFDVPPPLQINGSDSVRRNLVNWLNMFEGPAQVHFEDTQIIAGDDVAFLHTLTSVTPEGESNRSWVRVTVCYQKIDGKWLVVHEHASLPFNGQTTVEGLQP
jgi:uncharacterized protein (TIGR02246 family)